MQKIHWYEGLHLCPEHLQAQDTFLRAEIDDLINRLEPNLWGIAHIQTDITADKIILNAVTARFAEGMTVDYEYDNGPYQSHPPLEVYCPETSAPFSVYLACPLSGQQADRFLAIESKPFPTNLDHDKQTVETLPCLLPKLKLISSNQRPHPDQTLESDGIKYVVIEIARFDVKQNNKELDKSFIPPLLTLSANQWMQNSIQNIVEKAKKALTVQHQRVALLKKPPLDTFELTKAMLIYSTLARYGAMLDLLAQEIKQAPPKKAFATLTQMHNELIALEGGRLDDKIFLYYHNELFKTFNQLLIALTHQLSRLDMNWVLTDLEKNGTLLKTTLKGSVLSVMKRMVLVGPKNCIVSHFLWEADQRALQKTMVQKRQLPPEELSAYYREIEDNDERPLLDETQQLIFECNRDHQNWRTLKNNHSKNVILWVYVKSEPDYEQGWQLGVLS